MFVAVFYAILLAASAGAVRWGEWPERVVAALCWIGVVATWIVAPAFADRFRTADMPVLIVDALLLAAFVAVALRAERTWVLWVAAFQTISVAAPLGRAMNIHLWRLGYQLMEQLASYAVVIALAIGVTNQWRRRRAAGGSPRS